MNNFQLKNKTILITSPQPWGKLHVSKHHYALELAKKGNKIYFLNPPDNELNSKIVINQERENLFIIDYKPFFSFKIRFHFRKFFDLLMKFQIKKILKKIGLKINIIWCFEVNKFSNLNFFNADLKIYHPVDPVIYPFQINPAKTADFIFAVSEDILQSFKHLNKPVFFVNHGIDDYFEEFAKNNLQNLNYVKGEKIKAGYFGNLTRPNINEHVIKKIICENIHIDFYFWGPYSVNDNNLGGNKTSEFVEFLKNQKNVFLKGSKNKQELIEDIKNIDLFLLVYKEEKGSSDRSNSHKILEYMSTGKVIVANQFSTYISNPEIIEMPEENYDNLIPDLFNKVISNLDYYNSPELQRKRIEFALDNTYEKQIERIEKIISDKFEKITNR